ncbi:hypothetical protein SKAU_G00318860 [Synaphobranchus kaupii]|uniref:Uncharacterized protein n=1 Tax=Synaphobranchus kaupii TaxID=118154 RepID=A0A9Q1ET95_SYNKA|nr:hypothetical protein SKAU_G00318860 [Synaphobranchus kaupii]
MPSVVKVTGRQRSEAPAARVVELIKRAAYIEWNHSHRHMDHNHSANGPVKTSMAFKMHRMALTDFCLRHSIQQMSPLCFLA